MIRSNLNFSDALIEYRGYGKHKTPGSDYYALVNLYGETKAQNIINYIKRVECATETLSKGIDYSNLPQACTELQKRLTSVYGEELSPKAISAIVWSFAYSVWWK